MPANNPDEYGEIIEENFTISYESGYHLAMRSRGQRPAFFRSTESYIKNSARSTGGRAQTKFEVIVGAILTQNTNWGNVEKAIHRLKSAGVLSERALRDILATKLAALIKPAGYFNVKARRLKNFMRFFFDEYQGSLKTMGQEHLPHLRHTLLQVNGIGPETADSILLYALDKPVFVVDAYTKRFLYRHNLISPRAGYHQAQGLFSTNFDADIPFFQEYHALIVALGKNYCKPTPLCARCPLNRARYSLSAKCGSCHRAFLSGEKRIMIKSGFVCSDCRAKILSSSSSHALVTERIYTIE